VIAVVQRVSHAAVVVDGETVSSIGNGLLALVGVRRGDGPSEVELLGRKIAELRMFEDERHRMNRSVLDLGLPVLVVSQFTLCADLRRGRRPGFEPAEEPGLAEALVGKLADDLASRGLEVGQGRFGASMEVSLLNRGPVTFVLDTDLWRPRVNQAGDRRA